MSTNVKIFIDWVSNLNISNSDNEIFRVISDEEKRKQLAMFNLKEEGKKEILEELLIRIRSDINITNRFFENLCSLYPLTRNLLEYLLENMNRAGKNAIRAEAFLNREGTILRVLLAHLNKIRGNISGITSSAFEEVQNDANSYQKDIELLTLRKNELAEQIKKNDQKINERNKIEKEILKLEKDTDIHNLEKEIRNLKEKKSEIEAKHENYGKELSSLKNELKQYENINSDTEKKLITELIKLWP